MRKILFLALIAIFSSCEQKNATLFEPLLKQEPKKSPKWQKDLSGIDESCVPESGKLSQGSCAEHQICVPDTLDSSKGSCMIECGANVDGKLSKRPEACPKSLACMLLRQADLSPLGMFCQKPEERREMACKAPLDPEACLFGLSCVPTMTGKTSSGQSVHLRYRCKQECTLDAPCSGSEQCLSAKYGRNQVQSRNPCDLKACEQDDPNCSCNKSLGFRCTAIMPGVGIGICTREVGICGRAISWAKASDFRGESFLGENCNEMSDSRLCQNFPTGAAKPKCQTLGKSGEGLCIAPCLVPSEDGKSSQSLSCPKDYSCKTDVAKKLGLVVLLKEKDQLKPCDAKLCPEGLPCAPCGQEAECILIDEEAGKGHFCANFVGTCLAN
jgi:hypothetical protein